MMRSVSSLLMFLLCASVFTSFSFATLTATEAVEGKFIFSLSVYIVVIPRTGGGVLIPPYIEDDHSPLPGWTVESLKAVKYVDTEHFTVPGGKRAIELIGGKESAIRQLVRTIPGKIYVLTFKVGDGKNQCEGKLGVEVHAGKAVRQVDYVSAGKGGFKEGKVTFRAVAARTRIAFLSSYYTMTSDNSGSLCGRHIEELNQYHHEDQRLR